MNFGFSFQDVPGLQLSACTLVELNDCQIEMQLDEWDSVYFDVTRRNGSKVLFRGAGIPANVADNATSQSAVEREMAALPLEIWSGNYGHWVAYHLPKLSAFVENGWKDDIVLPERGRWLNVEERDATYLSLLAGDSVTHRQKLRQGVTRVKTLCIVDGDPHHEAMIRRAVNRLLSHPGLTPTPDRRRLFISRANAGYRRLTNEAALLARLQRLGFEPVSLENLSIPKQIEAFAGAECVVGMHGSGLANIIFCPRDAVVVEIIAKDFPCPDFYRLATTLGLRYYLGIAESTGDGQPGYRDLIAPLDKIASLVSEAIS